MLMSIALTCFGVAVFPNPKDCGHPVVSIFGVDAPVLPGVKAWKRNKMPAMLTGSINRAGRFFKRFNGSLIRYKLKQCTTLITSRLLFAFFQA
jgi:hypothetical protein